MVQKLEQHRAQLKVKLSEAGDLRPGSLVEQLPTVRETRVPLRG